MLDNIFVFQAGVFAAQAKAESDLSISMRYVFFMCDEHVLGEGFRAGQFSLDRGCARAICGFQ